MLVLFGLPLLFAVMLTAAIVSGRVSLSGLLSGQGTAVSPVRWQLLFCSIAGAVIYVDLVSSGDGGKVLPDVPAWLIPALIASDSIYLIGKAGALGAFRPLLERILGWGRR